MAQRDAFVLAEASVQLNVALVKKLGAGFFGGEGFILERLTGPGKYSFTAAEISSSSVLNMGQTLQVNTGCIVAFDDRSATTSRWWAELRLPCSAARGCSSLR